MLPYIIIIVGMYWQQLAVANICRTNDRKLQSYVNQEADVLSESVTSTRLRRK